MSCKPNNKVLVTGEYFSKKTFETRVWKHILVFRKHQDNNYQNSFALLHLYSYFYISLFLPFTLKINIAIKCTKKN